MTCEHGKILRIIAEKHTSKECWHATSPTRREGFNLQSKESFKRQPETTAKKLLSLLQTN